MTKVLVFERDERDEERTECKISVYGKILEQVNEDQSWRRAQSESTGCGFDPHSIR